MSDGCNAMVAERIERCQRFFAADRGALLVHATLAADDEADAGRPAPMPIAAVEWGSRASCREFARRRLAASRAVWREREGLDDDWIPSLQNLAGVGAIGAAFVKDAVVRHEATTNYLAPPVTDYERDLDRIGFDPDNPWFRAQMWMLEYYLEQWDGSFGLSPFTHFDPLDLCNQWRGNDLFYDFSEHPDALRRLLDKAADAILALEAYVRDTVMQDFPQEGSMLGVWTPGNYLSCDAGDLCSPDALRAWGLPYTQRIVTAWGGAYLHHHELGIHQIPTWSDCRGLSVQFLNRDPNTPHLADGIDERILRASLSVPICFIANYDAFCRHATEWAQGRFVVIVRCADRMQAERLSRRAWAIV